jgi:putative redox protein
MGERVIVRQNSQFETEVLAQDPHNPDDQAFYPAGDVRQLTPYGMLLAGLGSCTAIVMHTYAQYHDVPLSEAELRLEYDRVFADDCEDCENIHEYKEHIRMDIAVSGNLTQKDLDRLSVVSSHCPIHKMLARGIEVHARVIEEGKGFFVQPLDEKEVNV